MCYDNGCRKCADCIDARTSISNRAHWIANRYINNDSFCYNCGHYFSVQILPANRMFCQTLDDAYLEQIIFSVWDQFVGWRYYSPSDTRVINEAIGWYQKNGFDTVQEW